MSAGVYEIALAGRVYIGSSVDMDRRWYEHLKHLRAGKHHSRHLQRAFQKHGEAELSFVVLEIVADENDLLAREQFYLDALKPFGRNGFNSYPVAASTKGRIWTDEMRAAARIRVESCFRTPEAIALAAKNRIGLKQSEETKAKKSEALKRAIKTRPWWGKWGKGKKRTPEQVERIRQAQLKMWRERRAEASCQPR